jgi:hypothetical protein
MGKTKKSKRKEKSVKSTCLLVVASVLALSVTLAQAEQTAKQDDIKRFLTIIGARTIGLRVFNQIIASLQKAHPDIPESVWQEILGEAEAQTDGFVAERLVPIYDQYLTHDDIKGLIAFYESPLGAKLLSVMPQMSQESMLAGQTWGREFAETVRQRLTAQDSK